MLNSDGKWEKKVQKQQFPILRYGWKKVIYQRALLIETRETLRF